MKKTIEKYDFIDAFKGTDGKIDPMHGFTRWGLFALWDYLTEYEALFGVELEFDPIALRREFSEYKTVKEAREELGNSIEVLRSFDDGIIVRPF